MDVGGLHGRRKCNVSGLSWLHTRSADGGSCDDILGVSFVERNASKHRQFYGGSPAELAERIAGESKQAHATNATGKHFVVPLLSLSLNGEVIVVIALFND